MDIDNFRQIITLVEGTEKLEQIDLPYSHSALAPVTSKTTVDLHYGKLYKGYVDRYNKKEGDSTFNEAGAFLHSIWFSQFKAPKNAVQNILICGMGGSGIGGKLVSQWLQDELKVPVQLVQDYTFPCYVGPNTLVIGSSYSGETEETLFCVQKALEVVRVCFGPRTQYH
jgi:glucose-6-phosphate isomerase